MTQTAVCANASNASNSQQHSKERIEIGDSIFAIEPFSIFEQIKNRIWFRNEKWKMTNGACMPQPGYPSHIKHTPGDSNRNISNWVCLFDSAVSPQSRTFPSVALSGWRTLTTSLRNSTIQCQKNEYILWIRDTSFVIENNFISPRKLSSVNPPQSPFPTRGWSCRETLESRLVDLISAEKRTGFVSSITFLCRLLFRLIVHDTFIANGYDVHRWLHKCIRHVQRR